MTALLIIGPSWVGDMVLAQSLFITLKNLRPAAQIDVVAPAWSQPLLRRMPQIRQAIDIPAGHGELKLKARYVLGRQLRQTPYEQAIVLPNSFKSALLPYFANIPRRTGYTGEMRWGLLNDPRRLDKQVLSMTVQRFVALAYDKEAALPPDIPLPRLVAEPQQAAATIRRLGLEWDGEPVLAICPGAEYGPAKRWPAENFSRVAKEMHDLGWRVWALGSAKDRAIADAVSIGSNLAGRTTLEEAIDLLSLADLVVTNDSGLMHVAAALDRPVIAIFGSSDPTFTPPLGSRVRVLSLGLECSPCFQRTCRYGHYQCLRDLAPGRVFHAIEEMMQDAGTNR